VKGGTNDNTVDRHLGPSKWRQRGTHRFDSVAMLHARLSVAELASENIARDLSGAGTALSQKRTGERQQERAPHRGVGGKS
jgi:hypothetical protein